MLSGVEALLYKKYVLNEQYKKISCQDSSH